MEKRTVDVAVIGAGTAGMGAYRTAKAAAGSVAFIESGLFGTTCARVGCMPSKLLIAAAEAAHMVEKAPAFGVIAPKPAIDGVAVMKRVREERDRFVGFVLEAIDEFDQDDIVKGHARFDGENRLIVDDHTMIDAKAIVIATGSSPAIPPIFGDLGDLLIVNDDVFEWRDLPGAVAVFGPGVIGLELGQALHRLGVDVKIFGRGGQIGPLSDPIVRAECARVFGEEFYLNADADVRAIERVGDKARITFRCLDDQEKTAEFDHVIAATGRRPNVARLGLETTSLPLDARGMPIFDPHTLQIGQSSVFIAGDANNYRPLLHEAADEGRIAGSNAARFPDVRAGKRTASMGVVFSDPQIATVGEPFASLEEGCFAIGEVSFEGQGRSRTMLQNKGVMRVYAERGTGLFLGAEIFGPRAEHLAHLLAWQLEQRSTVDDLLAMPYYHPVVEEGLRTALRNLAKALQMGPTPVKNCIDCGPGA